MFFFPFLGATIAATSFFKLGALATKVAILTSSLYAAILVAIVLALYVLALQHRA
ncbi:MAG: hypothetical protein NTX31_00275 [Burkholderiales bacterium]|nr:hypothetical protein [Burkholderiales bacterium]